jgi:hypothetical protein
MPAHYDDEEKAFVAANAHLLTDPQMAAALSRLTGRTVTARAAGRLRQRLGVAKTNSRGSAGTPSRVVRRPDEQP